MERHVPALLLIFSISVFVFSSVHATYKVKYCDLEGDYPVKVQGVEIDPDPVVTGVPTTFHLLANSDRYIGGGKVLIIVSYFSIPVRVETHNLCDKVSCPVNGGDFELKHTQVLPTVTPAGFYTLMARMSDEDGNVLTCVSFHFRIYKHSPVSTN